MTNEEAIEILTNLMPMPIRGDGRSTTHLLQTSALMMAIMALKQQPKTGHWKEHDTTFGRNIYYCTACGRSIEILYKYDFCPLCGADMRGDSE